MTSTEIDTTWVRATPNLNKALSQLQGELPKVKKTKTGKVEGENKAGKYFSYEYSYADLGDVVADVGPLLAKFGLAFHCAPTINPADRQEMLLLWSLLHESGEEKAGEWPLGPVNQKPQSLGSAITYGRRYCFTAATNIVLEDDDDGQRAQQDHGSRQAAGDAWDTATPARPRQDAAEDTAKKLLAEADAVTSDAAAGRVTRAAADAKAQRLITRDECDKIQHIARRRIESLRAAAKPVNVEDLGQAAAAAHEAAEASQEPPPAKTGHDTPGTATTPQIGAIWTVLSTVFKFGKDEKDQARAVCSHVVGRGLASTKNMSWNEAKAVLDALSGWQETAEENGEQPRAFLIELMATAETGETSQDAA